MAAADSAAGAAILIRRNSSSASWTTSGINSDFTNDTDWSAVQPLVQKVMDARRDVGGGGMGRLFGRQPRRRSGWRQAAAAACLAARPARKRRRCKRRLMTDAPAAQIKDLLAKYKASQKAKQAKLAQAQADLRAVLTVKQEAQATLLGLVELNESTKREADVSHDRNRRPRYRRSSCWTAWLRPGNCLSLDADALAPRKPAGAKRGGGAALAGDGIRPELTRRWTTWSRTVSFSRFFPPAFC